jgi:hypothetical protein
VNVDDRSEGREPALGWSGSVAVFTHQLYRRCRDGPR